MNDAAWHHEADDMRRDGKPPRWISCREASRLADIDRRALPRVAARVGVRVREVPGERRRYLRADVVRLLSPEPHPAGAG